MKFLTRLMEIIFCASGTFLFIYSYFVEGDQMLRVFFTSIICFFTYKDLKDDRINEQINNRITDL